ECDAASYVTSLGHFAVDSSQGERSRRESGEVVTAEFVWMGESLVVMSAEAMEELRRQVREPRPNPRRRPSDSAVVSVRPEQLSPAAARTAPSTRDGSSG